MIAKAIDYCIETYSGEWWNDAKPIKWRQEFDYHEVIKSGTSIYVLGVKKKTLWLIIKGSDGDDWFGPGGNLSFFLTPLKKRTKKIKTNMKVSKGPLWVWQNEIKKKFVKCLFRHEIKKVVVTGHSKGGGVASIAAENIAYDYPTLKVKCFAFSAPRIGNKDFYTTLLGRVDMQERYMKGDIIPTLPPKVFGFYDHTNKRKIVKKKRKLIKVIAWPMLSHIPLYIKKGLT